MSELVPLTMNARGEEWTVLPHGKGVQRWSELVLEPNQHQAFEVDGRCIEMGDFELFANADIEIDVLMFDPKKVKHYVITAKGKEEPEDAGWFRH